MIGKNKLKYDLNEIKRMYLKKNMSMEKIAAHFEVTPQAILYRLKQKNIPRQRQGVRESKIERQTLERLHVVQRLSSKEIAAKLKIYHGVVKTHLKKFGIYNKFLDSKKWKNIDLSGLKIGDTTIFPKPSTSNPYQVFHRYARSANIVISIRTVDDENIRIKRIA